MAMREKLIVLRDKAGLSQLELAEKIGVSRQAIARWESTDAIPSVEKMKALANVYGVTLDWMCSEDMELPGERMVKEHTEQTNKADSEQKKVEGRKSKKIWIVLAVLLACIMMIVMSWKLTSKTTTKEVDIDDLPAEQVNITEESTFPLN